MEKCTFKPSITRYSKFDVLKQKEVPKGYIEQVNRMRKIHNENKVKKEQEADKLKGNRYEEERLKESNPPSFLKK